MCCLKICIGTYLEGLKTAQQILPSRQVESLHTNSGKQKRLLIRFREINNYTCLPSNFHTPNQTRRYRVGLKLFPSDIMLGIRLEIQYQNGEIEFVVKRTRESVPIKNSIFSKEPSTFGLLQRQIKLQVPRYLVFTET